MTQGDKRQLEAAAEAEPAMEPAKRPCGGTGGAGGEGVSLSPAAAQGASGASPSAGVAVFVPRNLSHAAVRIKCWQSSVAMQGGRIIEDEVQAAACTHIIVPASKVGCCWARLPSGLQPGSAAVPSGVLYVLEEWLEQSLGKAARLPEAAFCPPSPRAGGAAASTEIPAAEAAAAAARGDAAAELEAAAEEDAEEMAAAAAAVGTGADAAAAAAAAEAAAAAAVAAEAMVPPCTAATPCTTCRRALPDPVMEHGTWDMLVWNLWYGSVCSEERMRHLAHIIKDNGFPTFLLFQEVTFQHLHHLLELLNLLERPWSGMYHLVTPLPELSCQCFTAILCRKDSVHRIDLLPVHVYGVNDALRFNGFNRDLKSLSCLVGGQPLLLSTTHVMHVGGGRKQVNEMLEVLTGPGVSCPNNVVGGDLNWVPMRPSDKGPRLPAGWQDARHCLHPEAAGLTWDMRVCWQKGKKYGGGARLDRILCRLEHWQPAIVEIVGQQPIPGVARKVQLGSRKEIPVWVSDHLCLYARFSRR